MLWKAFVLWTVLCLAGFVGGDDDFDFLYWYPGRRKLASINSDEDGDNNPQSDYVDDDYTHTTEDYDSGKAVESNEVSAEDDYYFGNGGESAEESTESDYYFGNGGKSAEADYYFGNGGKSAEESAEADDDFGNGGKSAEADYDSGDGEESAQAFDETENTQKKRTMYGNIIEKQNPFLENYLRYTRLNLYNRYKRVQVVKASEWFQNFDHNKDLVILMHGGSSDINYVEDYFSTMAFALLQSADYNVIGIDWRHFYMKEKDVFDSERNVDELFKIGHILHSVVERALNSKFTKITPRTIYIGHGLGNVPVVVQAITYGYAFDVIYGLTPRYDLGSHNFLKLTQLHGKLVNLLPMNLYQTPLAHRNFYPVYNDEFYLKGGTIYLAYQVLSTAILFGNITARFCESEEAYNRGYCSKLTEIPLWHRSMSIEEKVPKGSYFFELPAPKLRYCCDGQTFLPEKHN